jgi:hypothetical protein
MISYSIQEFGILTWEQSTLTQQFHGQCYLSSVFLLEKLLATFFLSMIRKDGGYEQAYNTVCIKLTPLHCQSKNQLP